MKILWRMNPLGRGKKRTNGARLAAWRSLSRACIGVGEWERRRRRAMLRLHSPPWQAARRRDPFHLETHASQDTTRKPGPDPRCISGRPTPVFSFLFANQNPVLIVLPCLEDQLVFVQHLTQPSSQNVETKLDHLKS
jgi:hypothetical protein